MKLFIPRGLQCMLISILFIIDFTSVILIVYCIVSVVPRIMVINVTLLYYKASFHLSTNVNLL